jgi:hypothetical protein
LYRSRADMADGDASFMWVSWSSAEYWRTAESRKRDRKSEHEDETRRRSRMGSRRRILVRSSEGREVSWTAILVDEKEDVRERFKGMA